MTWVAIGASLAITALFVWLAQVTGPLPEGWQHPNVPPAFLPEPPKPPARIA